MEAPFISLDEKFIEDAGNGGGLLSPAFDINPVTSDSDLYLNISHNGNSLDYELVMEMTAFFGFVISALCKLKMRSRSMSTIGKLIR